MFEEGDSSAYTSFAKKTSAQNQKSILKRNGLKNIIHQAIKISVKKFFSLLVGVEPFTGFVPEFSGIYHFNQQGCRAVFRVLEAFI